MRPRSTQAPDLHALFMATLTLTRMAEGGMYDQLGGGFARYSVDQFWMIPHFEKMLYDNGALLATLRRSRARHRRCAVQAHRDRNRRVDAARDAGSEDGGGFYSAYDADSEGHEGKFYVWTRTKCAPRSRRSNGACSAGASASTRQPNFEGAWHRARVRIPRADRQGASSSSPPKSRNTLDTARAKLLAIRSKRVWPGLDDKMLTQLECARDPRAGHRRALARQPEFARGRRTRARIRARQPVAPGRRRGRLLATAKDGVAHLNAYLDDYAYLANALLEMLQLRWRNEDVAWLREILDAMLAHFEDAKLGGFFFTSDDHEALIHRSKSFSDDAIPAGNGIAARALIRAGYLLGETRWLEAAERTLRAAWLAINRFPHGHMSLLEALAEYLDPPEIVIIRERTADAAAWQRELGKLYAPHRMVFSIPAKLDGLDAAVADKKAGRGTRAYVCRGSTCSAPVESLADLVRTAQARV